MKIHYHASIENIILYGLSAVIFIDVVGIGAAMAAKSNNPLISKVGVAVGAIVPFKG